MQGDAASTFAAQARFIESLQAQVPALAGLGEGLSRLVNDYARELGHPALRISNSWFNQRPGSLLRHPPTRRPMSRPLCIASDEHSSKLFFENPNPLIGFVGHAHPTEFNMEMARFKLDPGDLLLFPSWLKHGSRATGGQVGPAHHGQPEYRGGLGRVPQRPASCALRRLAARGPGHAGRQARVLGQSTARGDTGLAGRRWPPPSPGVLFLRRALW